MRLGRFSQTTADRKHYTIDYSEWLDVGEQVASVTYSVDHSVTTPLVVNGSVIAGDGKSILFFVSGGDDGETYKVIVTATTTAFQVKADFVMYTTHAP